MTAGGIINIWAEEVRSEKQSAVLDQGQVQGHRFTQHGALRWVPRGRALSAASVSDHVRVCTSASGLWHLSFQYVDFS